MLDVKEDLERDNESRDQQWRVSQCYRDRFKGESRVKELEAIEPDLVRDLGALTGSLDGRVLAEGDEREDEGGERQEDVAERKERSHRADCRMKEMGSERRRAREGWALAGGGPLSSVTGP